MAAPASKVGAAVRSPTNMAAAKTAAVDFNKMTSIDRTALAMFVGEDLLANRWLQTLLLLCIGRNKSSLSREYLI